MNRDPHLKLWRNPDGRWLIEYWAECQMTAWVLSPYSTREHSEAYGVHCYPDVSRIDGLDLVLTQEPANG